jgi:hypothetical protein
MEKKIFFLQDSKLRTAAVRLFWKKKGGEEHLKNIYTIVFN